MATTIAELEIDDWIYANQKLAPKAWQLRRMIYMIGVWRKLPLPTAGQTGLLCYIMLEYLFPESALVTPTAIVFSIIVLGIGWRIVTVAARRRGELLRQIAHCDHECDFIIKRFRAIGLRPQIEQYLA